MASFNPIIEQAKHISIISGQLDNASFSFVAYENSSIGTMKFKYHDLKIKMSDKNVEKTGLKGKLKTFLVNELLVNDSNPGKDGILYESTIHAEHNPYRSFLYYSMQTTLSGIKPSIENKKTVAWLQKKNN